MQLTGQVFPHCCQFKGELMSFCTPGVWVGSKPFSKSPQCGVSLPLITEFNFNQEIFLNTWTHFSRDAASKWSNALMWPQKSSFILRGQVILTFSICCRQVKEQLQNWAVIWMLICDRYAKVMSSLLTMDQSAEAPSMQGASLQTVSPIDIFRTSRSSSHIWVYETPRHAEIRMDLAERQLRLLFWKRISRLTCKCQRLSWIVNGKKLGARDVHQCVFMAMYAFGVRRY